MPELLLQQTSPYATRRATLLRGEGDVYLYLEDLIGPTPTTVSAVWVANVLPAPSGHGGEGEPGTPPRMGAGGTRHPEGCPPMGDRLELVWFEEGDAVAVVDGEGVLAAIPGWAGRNEFYGYARYARGRSPLAWELTREASKVLEHKVVESREFWTWRCGSGAWTDISASGMAHLQERLGPEEGVWPLETGLPEVMASRHRLADASVWVTATTGLSAQRMAGVEQYVDDADRVARIELAVARPVADQVGAEVLAALAAIPFNRCTWLGEGHTIGGAAGSYPGFGPDKAALLLTVNPPPDTRCPRPDLSGLSRRGEQVTYLWVMVIDEEAFRLARGRDARTAVQHLADSGATWIQ